jgi:hypothetical protein
VFIGFHTFPLLFLTGMMSLPAAFFLFIALPSLALYGAPSVRQAPASSTGAWGQILIGGTLTALLLSLMPWTYLLILAASPWLRRP